MKDDQYYLKLAIDEGNKNPKPYNFGAVIVDADGNLVAQDHNHVNEHHDPSAHAEVSVIRKATASLKSNKIDGYTMYGSHEPCLMCFCCAAWANITRVVYATPASEETTGSYEFNDVGLHEIAQKLVKPIRVEHIHLNNS